MWAHDFCLLFQIFITHNFLYHYAMAIKFQRIVRMQLALWCKLQNVNTLFQYWDITYRVMGCSLCPHALFLQAQSHLSLSLWWSVYHVNVIFLTRNVMQDVTRLLYLLNKKPHNVQMPPDGMQLLNWSEEILRRYLQSQVSHISMHHKNVNGVFVFSNKEQVFQELVLMVSKLKHTFD